MNKKFSDNKIKKSLYAAAVFIICIEMFFCFYDEKCLTVYAATKAFQDSDDYDDIFEKLEIAADDYTGLSYKEIFAYIW